jgi:hypothetical protein
MKKFHLILFFLFSIRIFSQINVSTIQSNIFKDDFGKSDLEFAESDGKGGVISIRSFIGIKEGGFSIIHYDSDLKLIKDYILDIQGFELKGTFVEENVINLIMLQKDQKTDEYRYYQYSSNIDQFNFTSRLFFSLDDKYIKENFKNIFDFFSYKSLLDEDTFGNIVFSENKSFFAISLEINDKKEKYEAHKIIVFNDKFQQIFVFDFSKKINHRLFEYQDLVVDDQEGIVYFIGKSYENDLKSTKYKGKPNYHFEIYKVDKNGQKLLSFKNLEKFVNSAYLVHNNNQLTCVGFYSEENDFKYKGVFKMVIDYQSMNINNQVFLPFSDQFIIDKYGELKNEELRDIFFRKIFVAENGDIVINAEEFHVTSYYVKGMNGLPGHWVTTTFFGDIIAVNISSENTIKWARNINKNQTGEFKFYSHSYFSTLVNGKDYFFVNLSDNIKKLRDDRIVFIGKKPKKSNLYVIVIDEKGNMDYKKLLDDSEAEVSYSVKNGVFRGLEKNSIVFQGRSTNKNRLIKVNIN